MKKTIYFFLFYVCFCANPVNAQVNVQDSLALVDLYNSTDGPNWHYHTNWLTSPISKWAGVTVTNTRVTEISLYGFGLNGSIPSSFGNLTNLQRLELSSNQLRGSIPSSIGNFINLQYLYLNNNQFTGSIPSSIGNLVNLQSLELDGNLLIGSIPASLGNLVHLTDLQLYSNQLTGSIPSSLGKLVHLQLLLVGGNQLTGSIPSSFGNLKNLYYLSLSRNQLTGSIPSSLGNLINLQSLSLSYNQLSGSIPSLDNLIHLGDIDLSYNLVSGSIPSSFGNFSLSHLVLRNNHLSGSIPSSLGNLGGLRSLLLDSNRLSGSIPSSLGNLGNLRLLFLDNNRLSGSIPSSLSNLRPLCTIGLTHNYFTFDGMELFAQTFGYGFYSPQKRIPIHQHGNTLSVSAGGTLSNNTYKWFKCEGTTCTLVSTIKGDSVFHPSGSGKYYVRVLNSVATQLKLFSKSFNYTAPTNTLIASAQDAVQQNAKTNLFRVYPNPAKDILHVETNGNATFSLIDQSGKILVTTSINGKGSVNISGITPGLYYLKNTSTGNVQKVVIAR